MGKRGFRKAKEPKGPRLTEATEELLTMAARLIDDHHGHLAEATISYWMVNGNWASGGKDVVANAQLVTGANRKETGNTFRILVSEKAWNDSNEKQREYTLDSQLTRLCKGETGNGEARWYMRDYALKTFPSLVQSYGLITPELRNFDNALRQTKLEFAKETAESVNESTESVTKDAKTVDGAADNVLN